MFGPSQTIDNSWNLFLLCSYAFKQPFFRGPKTNKRNTLDLIKVGHLLIIKLYDYMGEKLYNYNPLCNTCSPSDNLTEPMLRIYLTFFFACMTNEHGVSNPLVQTFTPEIGRFKPNGFNCTQGTAVLLGKLLGPQVRRGHGFRVTRNEICDAEHRKDRSKMNTVHHVLFGVFSFCLFQFHTIS